MFGNWQQMAMGGVPPPYYAQPNMMYQMYPNTQEAAAALAVTTTGGVPPHPHQLLSGGQMGPMMYPPMSHPPMVSSTGNTVLEQTSASTVAGNDPSSMVSGGAPPLPSNPAPPAPPTEEKPPLPPEPPPPEVESKKELTARNPEEEKRMEQLKQQAAQWQQHKKQLDDAQQYHYQLQQQQFHQMWMATQYPPPPTEHLMPAPLPYPPNAAPVPPLPQQHNTDVTTMPSIPGGSAIGSQSTAPPPASSSSFPSLMTNTTTHSVPMMAPKEPVKHTEKVKSPDKKANAPVTNQTEMNFTDKDGLKSSTSAEQPELTNKEKLAQVEKEEEEFNRQYIEWKKQYDDWRLQNRGHPDREQFKQYEMQFTEIEAKMSEKREDIIRRKRLLKGEYVPDSGDPYTMVGKCGGRMSDSARGQHGMSAQISQFSNQDKFGGGGGGGPQGKLPEEKNNSRLDTHGKIGSSLGGIQQRLSKLAEMGPGEDAKNMALESTESASFQKDLNSKKEENDPFLKGNSSQDNESLEPFPGGTGSKPFAGPMGGRFDRNRNRFDGSSQGPTYQGGQFASSGPGVQGEGPVQEGKGSRVGAESEFRDSDMRSQGSNQGPMRGPRFNGPWGGPEFGQNLHGGPGFNQGSFQGPGFNQNIRGFNQYRRGGGDSGSRGLGNRGVPMQRMGGPLHHDGQFSRFAGHGGMGMSPAENSQQMSERNQDSKEAENVCLSDKEISNKILPKDGSDNQAGGEAGLNDTGENNNDYNWKHPDLPDATGGFHDPTEPCNRGGGGGGSNNFNSEQTFNQNDNWRRFGPPPPGNMRGQGVRMRGGLQQPPPPHRNFEEESGPWGMQGPPPRMGPDFNFNMNRGGGPAGPRMMGGPCEMRPGFNSGMGPPGMGPNHRGMMRGGGGMGMRPPFRSNEMGRPFDMNLPGNRFDGGYPRGDPPFDSMGPNEQESLNQGEAGMMGSRRDFPPQTDQHSRFGSYPPPSPHQLQQFSRGNCQPNSMEMNRDGKCMPKPFPEDDFNRGPFNSHPNSSNRSDTWPSRDRPHWQENQFGYDNDNSGWNSDKRSFPANPNMDPDYRKGFNRDFPSDTGQPPWSGDFPGPHSDGNGYNQSRPPFQNTARPMDYDYPPYRNMPNSRDGDYTQQGPPTDVPPYPDRLSGNEFNSPYTETIDYEHKSAKEMFDYSEDPHRNQAPTVIDYGHKHPNQLDEPKVFTDTDLRVGLSDGNQEQPRNERGNRTHVDRDRSPLDAGDKPRDSERDRFHGDVDRLRGRDKDAEMRNRDLRDRNRPMARDRDRDRDRGRDRDKFRDGRYDPHSRVRERIDDEDKWSDRKHDDRKFDRNSRGRYNSPNRGYHAADAPRSGESYSKCRPPVQTETKAELVSADDLLCKPGRDKRPPQVVVIIRGLPGSGKTYVSKLIRDKETSNGGTAPRMLCMDDYFMVEVEKVEKDTETNKMVKKKVLQYEYEPDLEEVYRQSILKSFKKTIDDGFFPFIIYDCVNEKVQHFEEFWSYAKSKGFQVYVATVHSDVPTCVRRNIHGRTNPDITKIQKNWEPTPKHHIHLDIRSLLQDAAIPEVEMEDTTEEVKKEESPPVKDKDNDKDKDKTKSEADEEDEPAAPPGYIKSKWEIDEVGQVRDKVLDKLDGIRLGKRRRSSSPNLSLDDYLQLDVYKTRQTDPGKKRVRWADMEERKQRLRRRELGFVVGQTQHDWEKITDDTYADRALNRTKYI